MPKPQETLTISEYKSRRTEKVKESEVQGEVIRFLAILGLIAVVIPNRGLYDGRTGRYNRKEKDHIAGVPDIIVVLREGKTLWIETKRPVGGVVSICQESFHAHLAARKHLFLVARTVGEVETFIRTRGLI